ncbi:hypothetical protein PTKIN_Ptkin08bG0071300 [Pterospermum kingtungense]
MALCEAFFLFSSSCWNGPFKLVIESESTNAIKWVMSLGKAPWRFRSIIQQIKFLKTQVSCWYISHTCKEENSYTNRLAKDGVFRKDSLIQVF